KPAAAAANPMGKQIWFASQEIDLRLAEGQPLASPNDFRPTPQEMRAMNYLAVTKGVKGLLFYGQGGSPNPSVHNEITEYPAQWQEALRMASELRYLSPALAAGQSTQTVSL